MKKRLLSILLAALMVVSLLPVTAFATDLPAGATGWLVDEGDNHVWYKLEDTNGDSSKDKLTVGGTGAMPDYSNKESVPWYVQGGNAITTVTIETGVTHIGKYAFYYCESLPSVTIPSSVTTIGDTAFGYCYGLSSVTIPSSVTTIGEYAFYCCSSLPSVTIPSSVSNIGNQAFCFCDALTSMKVEATTPPALGNYAFYDCNSNLKIYVPTASVDAYKTDTNWSSYATMIEAEAPAATGVAKIGDIEYTSLASAVAAVPTDGTATEIKLLADCVSGGITIPSGVNLTIDFGGKTVTFNKPGAGSTGTKTIGFQILQGSTVVMKNGNLECAAENKDATWESTSTEKGIAMMIQNYADLTLDGMTINGANIAHNGSTVRYMVSINSGTVAIKDTAITAPNGDFAFDACKYGSYAVPTVGVNGTSSITGNVELTGGKLSVAGTATITGTIKTGTGYNDGDLTVANTVTLTAPEGYEWVDNANGTKSLVAEAEAMIGGKRYETFADAIADAKASDEIKLIKDITITEQLEINKAITLDGNGKTITRTPGGATAADKAGILVTAGATLMNLTVSGPNTDGSKWDEGEYGIKFYNANNATLNEVTVKNANAGIQVNGGKVHFTGSIDVSGNEWGGVEVCNKGELDVSTAALKNDGETEANPVLWNDGGKDDSFGTIKFSAEDQLLYKKTVKNDKENKEHYYTDGDAKLTDASGNTFGYRTLEEALAAAQDGDTITLLDNITTEGFTVPEGVTLDLGGKTVNPAPDPNFKGISNKGTIIIYSENKDQLGYLLYDAVDENGGKYVTGEGFSLTNNVAGLGSNNEIVAKRTADGKQIIEVTVNTDSQPNSVAWNMPVGKDTEIKVNGKLQVLADIEIKGKLSCTTLVTNKTITLTDGGQLIVTDLKNAADAAETAIDTEAGANPSDAVTGIVAAAKEAIAALADPTTINNTDTVDAKKAEIIKLQKNAMFDIYKQQTVEQLSEKYKDASDAVETILNGFKSITDVSFNNAMSIDNLKGEIDAKIEVLEKAADLQIAKEQAIAAIEEKAGNPEFRSDAMKAIVTEYTGKINKATTVDEISGLREEALTKESEQHMLDCTYEEEVPIADDIEVKLYLGGKYMSDVTIHEVEGGWSIQNAESKYLTMKDGKLALSDNAFAWTYKNGAFSTSVKTTQKTSGHWFLFIYIPGSTKTVTTTYYLSTVTDGAKLSTCCTCAELYTTVSGEHDFGCWIGCKDGEHHKRVCKNCGEVETEAHDFGETTHKCVCGAYDPSCAVMDVTATYATKTQKQFSGFLFWGTWKNVTTYTATVKVNAEGMKVTKVEVSANQNKGWTKSNTFTSNSEIKQFFVRVTTSDGAKHLYRVANGIGYPAN